MTDTEKDPLLVAIELLLECREGLDRLVSLDESREHVDYASGLGVRVDAFVRTQLVAALGEERFLELLKQRARDRHGILEGDHITSAAAAWTAWAERRDVWLRVRTRKADEKGLEGEERASYIAFREREPRVKPLPPDDLRCPVSLDCGGRCVWGKGHKGQHECVGDDDGPGSCPA